MTWEYGWRNIEDLACKIENVVNNSQKYADKIRKARRFIEAKYAWDAAAQNMKKMLLELLKGKNNG